MLECISPALFKLLLQEQLKQQQLSPWDQQSISNSDSKF